MSLIKGAVSVAALLVFTAVAVPTDVAASHSASVPSTIITPTPSSLEDPAVVPQPTGVITGLVVAASDARPLASVQVSIPGTGLGVVSDSQGRYTISGVPAGEVTVRAQLLGYRTEERTVTVGSGETVNLDFQVSPQALDLDEIVVTGTAGGEQRRAVGNVVSRIDAAAVSEAIPIQDVGSMLNARASGVVVMPGSGMVGAGSRIRIRGASSFSLSDQPLIYVDGVRLNNQVSSGPAVQGFGSAPTSRLSDINPADIESIEVIKGPAAATLYGTEAANGVIQIITKQGAAGEALQLNVRIRQGATWLPNAESRIPPNVWRNPGTGEVIESNLLRQERERGTPIFTPGHLSSYGVDMSGGFEQLRYFVGVNYDADNGIEPTNSLRRLSGRMNLSTPLHETLDVSVNLGLIRSDTDFATENAGVWFDTRMGHPQTLDTPQRGFWRRPPEANWNARSDTQLLNRATTGAVINHRPTSWMTQRLTLGLDLTSEDNQTVTPRMGPELAPFYSAQAALGSKTSEMRNSSYVTADYAGTVSLPISDRLSSNTSFGFQYYRNHTQITDAFGREFPALGLTTIGSAAVTFGNDDYFTNATVGMYGQQQFGWDGRAFLTFALRADDNSAFGSDFSIVTYPKVSASWVLSEEEFWDIPLVSTFRLRTAFGASGQQPETFAALRTFTPITTGLGTGAVSPQFIGNPELGPERGQELEFGFEASLADDRITADFTYYNQETKDAILLRQQPPSLGFPASQFVNVGAIRNTGLELQLNAIALRTPGTQLDLGFNLSRNRNEVLDLAGEDFIALGAQQHRVGYPIASWWEQRAVSAEIDQNGVATNVMCDGGPENDHQPVPCSEAPRVFLGVSQPKLEGGFMPTLTVGGFSVTATVDFKLGHKKDDTNRMARCVTRQICPENVWPEEYDPVITAEIQDPSLFPSNIRINDASFTRLREVAVNYALPDRWAEAIGGTRASVNVGARNVYTWTDWTGLDPEAYRMGELHNRAEQEAMPQLTQLVTRFNVTF
jgi:TonB-dependent SusC/RagA subfamily outer membrane receptor